MKRKGISPLIAAVLLIAFTMAVASIFAQWAPQLMQDAQGNTKDQANTIQNCSDMTMDVDVDNNDNTATVQQTGGNEGVGNFTITFRYDSSDPTQNTTNASSDLDSPRSITTIDAGNTNDITEAEVRPTSCEGAPTATWEQ
jgi:flagellin-like protein